MSLINVEQFIFQPRRDTAANWQTHNPVLRSGEFGIVTDSTNEDWLKVGDGTTAWNSLAFKHGPQGIQGANGTNGRDGIDGANGQDGYTPVKGTDYFTPEDIESLGIPDAVDEAVEESVGDIDAVLATLVTGSTAIPQSIIDKLSSQAATELVTLITNRVISSVTSQIASSVESSVASSVAGSVSTLNQFITDVQFRETGSIEVEPNAIYGIISETAAGTISVFDRESGEPVTITGKMLALITGNYNGDEPPSVHGLAGAYQSLVVTRGVYIALGQDKQGTVSWEGNAMVVVIKSSQEVQNNDT